jgi:hypothetical protein
MTDDKFGIEMKYQTKPGGQEYFFDNNDPTSDARFDWSSIQHNKLNGEEGWHATDDSPRIHILSQDVIGFSDADFEPGGKMQGGFDFKNLEELGHWYKDSDWKNVEITCHVRIHSCNADSEGFGFEVRSVRHKSNPKNVKPGSVYCGGSAYHGNFHYHDPESASKDEKAPKGSTRFRKENYHVHYDSHDYSDNGIGDVTNKWFGFKFVVYNATNGNVKMETWLDKDCSNNWVKNNSDEDTGSNWGEEMKTCGCSSNTAKITWGSPLIRLFKNNKGLDWDIRRLSCREIAPPT